jgi:ribosomal-protein-alanine N-acetyltransferase
MTGLALETATDRVEVLACDAQLAPLALRSERVGHGHVRRLAELVRETLAEAKLRPEELRWVAADLGPGSFTGIRVGLATAQAIALVAGAEIRGASSLAALAHGASARGSLVVPLVPAGRRDAYAGWFRADARGRVTALAAPEVGPPALLVERTREALALVPRARVRFVGPGLVPHREALEVAFVGSTSPAVREEGLSALDLARAAASGLGPAAGLPSPGGRLDPLYVRPAQAEERVRHRAAALIPTHVRPFVLQDVPAVARIERQVFTDAWPETFFASELSAPFAYARIAERDGALVGYSMAWLGAGTGHLGNLAVVPGARRRGVARLLLEDLEREARSRGIEAITLEVRVSNDAAQWLYRRHGYRLAGLRRRYYRDTGEDALILEWRP